MLEFDSKRASISRGILAWRAEGFNMTSSDRETDALWPRLHFVSFRNA
jgi:hypothetical protein